MPNNDPSGTVVISVDAELGWGFHDFADPPSNPIEYARTGWRRLVGMLDEYRLPATWGIVGHLFLEGCDGHHADHPAPSGWFEREREEWADRPELRFGRGLIETVESSRVDHELANHSFSHVLFRDDISPELARADVVQSHVAAGRDFDSFIYPRNIVGHRDQLAAEGYTCYRGAAPHVTMEHSGRVWKMVRLLGGTSLLATPTIDEYGLVNVPASLFLFSFEGVARAFSEWVIGDPVVRQVRAGIDEAARTGGMFHVWLHPNNIWYDHHAHRLREVFGMIASARAEDRITVEPMGEVANRVLAEASAEPTAEPASPAGVD